jgi:ribosomal-protein-alanine N-acetyltransferase
MKFILETERLRLREIVPEDAAAMFDLNSDPEVVQYTGDAPFENVEAARIFLENYAAYKKYNRGRWICELKSSGEIIGWCGLKFYEDSKLTDVGYRLFKKHWGKGYATEAAKACIAYGFSFFKLDKIVAHARKDNKASLRVLEKCGMKITGEGLDFDGEIFNWEIKNPE